MHMTLDKQQKMYDWAWNDGLARGKEDWGNLETNLAFLANTHLLHPHTRVLEIGCGVGTLAHRLTNQGCQVVATDISNNAIAHGRKKYPDLELLVSPAEELPFPDDHFDLVVSFDLLEHLFYVDRHLAEVKRILRPKGYYLFATPNRYCSATYATIRSGNFTWQKSHPSLHTYRQLQKRLKHHDFQPHFMKMNTINEFSLAKLRFFGPLPRLVRKLDTRRLPWNLQSNFYVMARKP